MSDPPDKPLSLSDIRKHRLVLQVKREETSTANAESRKEAEKALLKGQEAAKQRALNEEKGLEDDKQRRQDDDKYNDKLEAEAKAAAAKEEAAKKATANKKSPSVVEPDTVPSSSATPSAKVAPPSSTTSSSTTFASPKPKATVHDRRGAFKSQASPRFDAKSTRKTASSAKKQKKLNKLRGLGTSNGSPMDTTATNDSSLPTNTWKEKDMGYLNFPTSHSDYKFHGDLVRVVQIKNDEIFRLPIKCVVDGVANFAIKKLEVHFNFLSKSRQS